MRPSSATDTSIARGLRHVFGEVSPLPRGGWRAAIVNGRAYDLDIRIADPEWVELTIHGQVPALTPRDPWMLLRQNARLRGGARFACVSDGRLVVRADLIVGESIDGTSCLELRSWLDGLYDDVLGICHATAAGAVEASCDGPWEPVSVESAGTLARLCTEAGWNGRPDAAGAVGLWLESGAVGAQASLTLSNDGTLSAVVPFAGVPTSDASRAAVAQMLLRVSSTVRAVKGVATGEADERPALAAAWSRPLRSADDLDRALSALSVACALTIREVQALNDDVVARDHLELNSICWPDAVAASAGRASTMS